MGASKGNNGGGRIPRQEDLRSKASVRPRGARALEGRRGAGPRRDAPGPARRWAANAALASAAASAVSRLLSGWGAGVNLSPPRPVQSQARSHARAGRAERADAQGRRGRRRDSPSGRAPLPRAVGGPRARRALRSLRRRGREGPRRRRGAAQAAPGPGEWSNLTAGTRRRRAGGNGGGGGGAGRHQEAWAVTRAPERGPMVLEGPRRPVLQVRRAPAEPLCVRGGPGPAWAPRPWARAPAWRAAAGWRGRAWPRAARPARPASPPPGSAPRPRRPSRVAAPEGLRAFAPAPDGDAGAAARGGERVLTARPGRPRAGL